jgi:hypothetical protein
LYCPGFYVCSIVKYQKSDIQNKGNIRISLSWYFTIGQYNQDNTIISLSWYFTIGHKNKGNIRISLSWYFTIGQYNQDNTIISLSWYFTIGHKNKGNIRISLNYQKGALDSRPQVIKFTSYLPRAGGSLRVLRRPPPLKLVAMI